MLEMRDIRELALTVQLLTRAVSDGAPSDVVAARNEAAALLRRALKEWADAPRVTHGGHHTPVLTPAHYEGLPDA
jgi:hypothetical protein